MLYATSPIELYRLAVHEEVSTLHQLSSGTFFLIGQYPKGLEIPATSLHQGTMQVYAHSVLEKAGKIVLR